MILYHGGTDIIEVPRIIPAGYGRDFGVAFYTTDIYEQASKWAKRQGRIRRKRAILNIYEFDNNKAAKELKFKVFTDYSMEWLEFVVNSRANPYKKHGFDIVFGKIANDDVGETVQAVVEGFMPFDFALNKLSFMEANNQYAFCSERSLPYVRFSKSQEVG
jgi:hypothetical protein